MLCTMPYSFAQSVFRNASGNAARVKIITSSLVILGNLFPQDYRYRYRLEVRMN